MKPLNKLFLFLAILPLSITAYFYPSSASPEKAASITLEPHELISCYDADTCRFKKENGAITKIRFIGIDAPEMADGGQPYAKEGRDYLLNLLQGKKIAVKFYSKDMYGRELSEIYIDQINVNIRLVEEGFAEAYRGKAPSGVNTALYIAAETKAKEQRKNIWSQNKYVSPKEFRTKSKENKSGHQF